MLFRLEALSYRLIVLVPASRIFFTNCYFFTVQLKLVFAYKTSEEFIKSYSVFEISSLAVSSRYEFL